MDERVNIRVDADAAAGSGKGPVVLRSRSVDGKSHSIHTGMGHVDCAAAGRGLVVMEVSVVDFAIVRIGDVKRATGAFQGFVVVELRPADSHYSVRGGSRAPQIERAADAGQSLVVMEHAAADGQSVLVAGIGCIIAVPVLRLDEVHRAADVRLAVRELAARDLKVQGKRSGAADRSHIDGAAGNCGAGIDLSSGNRYGAAFRRDRSAEPGGTVPDHAAGHLHRRPSLIRGLHCPGNRAAIVRAAEITDGSAGQGKAAAADHQCPHTALLRLLQGIRILLRDRLQRWNQRSAAVSGFIVPGGAVVRQGHVAPDYAENLLTGRSQQMAVQIQSKFPACADADRLGEIRNQMNGVPRAAGGNGGLERCIGRLPDPGHRAVRFIGFQRGSQP